jgi:protoporphyrinogen oxidase
MNKILVLGAGIAGISAAYRLKQENLKSIVFEQKKYWGGLLNSFTIEGFTFDTFVHLAFSKDENVNKDFQKNSNIINHLNSPINYYKGKYLKHPVQNNLFRLDVKDKIKVIEDFVNRDQNQEINNYEDWLYCKYGKFFSDEFPMKYTRKYWTVDAKELETDWVSVRMYKPTLEEILNGAFSENTQNYNYAPDLRYPDKGGYKTFLKDMVDNIEINCDKKVIEIDTENKTVLFEDLTKENYSDIISTLPLTEICKCIKNIPIEVKNASEKLEYTSGALVSLGFNRCDVPKNLMTYIYDEEILASRIYSPSLKSINNAPIGFSSLQAEIYFSKNKQLPGTLNEVLDKTIEQLIGIGMFNEEDLILKDIRVIKYANVIFKLDIYENRSIVKKYLESQNILSAGRFGEWDYLWSDQAFISGKKAAEVIIASKISKKRNTL